MNAEVLPTIDLNQIYFNFSFRVVLVVKNKKTKVINPGHQQSVYAHDAEGAIVLAKYNVRNKMEVLHVVKAVAESIGVAFYRFGDCETLTKEERNQIPLPQSVINPELFQRK